MQFLDILNILSPGGKAVFVVTVAFISLWIYLDSKKRGLKGWLWAFIVFFFPMLFPVYILIRPRYTVGFCAKCGRILPRNFSECYYCEDTEKVEDESPIPILVILRSYILRFLLEIFRTCTEISGFCLFLFKRKFLLLNLKFLKLYPWGMCHQIVATEGKGRGIPKKTLTYGETLFFSAWKVFTLAGITEKDVFYDLGSGIGKVVFFCNILYGIEAFGVEIIPTFVEYSNRIKEELAFDKVTFIEGNFLDLDISKGTVFFIVATAFDSVTRENLAEKFREVQEGTRIVTVSYILEGEHLEVKNKSTALFSGNYEEIYLHVRV